MFVKAPKSFQLTFQEPGSPIMEAIINLHNYIMFYIIVILLFVFYNMARIYFKYSYKIYKLSANNIYYNFEKYTPNRFLDKGWF